MRGKAIHTTASIATRGHAARGKVLRVPGMKLNAKNPNKILAKTITPGCSRSSPMSMKRNDDPQIQAAVSNKAQSWGANAAWCAEAGGGLGVAGRPADEEDGEVVSDTAIRIPIQGVFSVAGQSRPQQLCAWDDFPVHQTSEPIRYSATSDRNFYDRYYFNAFARSGGPMIVFGFGQYPNLGVTDAFAVWTEGDVHRVVRASRPLSDRADLHVGPLSVEVLEPLRSLRIRLAPNEWEFDFDLTWSAAGRAWLEPRHFVRSAGRVVFDTQRLAQTGGWSGEVRIGSGATRRSYVVEPHEWWGTRDRSWGVRPIGAAEPPGIHAVEPVMTGLWHYNPVRFDGFDVFHMCQETNAGVRTLEEAVLVPHDPGAEPVELGRASSNFELIPGTRVAQGAKVSFSHTDTAVGASISAEHLASCYIGVGTGYGLEADWRHGMYQGPDLVVQGLDASVADVAPLGQYVVVDHGARWTAESGLVGWGLHEHGFFGPFDAAGLTT